MVQETGPQLQPVVAEDPVRRSILIVEDDPAQVMILMRRLEQQGYQTSSAHTGGEGLVQARSERPDLVLLDLGLPDMDGFELCERLVDEPQTCGIPVIILSGLDRGDIVRSARACGCKYFVHKPYDPNALLTLIEHSLETASRYEWG